MLTNERDGEGREEKARGRKSEEDGWSERVEGVGARRRRRRAKERGRGSEGPREGRRKLLDRELVACSLKKNWKSAVLDGPGDPWGDRGGNPGVLRTLYLSAFLLAPSPPSDKKESLTASDNLASQSSPHCPVAWPHTDRPRDMTRLFLR